MNTELKRYLCYANKTLVLFGEVILGSSLMVKLSTFHFTFEINVIVFFFVPDPSNHFVVNIWCKSSTTFHFIIKISFTVVLILYQVLQVTLWLEGDKVTFVASF